MFFFNFTSSIEQENCKYKRDLGMRVCGEWGVNGGGGATYGECLF